MLTWEGQGGYRNANVAQWAVADAVQWVCLLDTTRYHSLDITRVSMIPSNGDGQPFAPESNGASSLRTIIRLDEKLKRRNEKLE